MLFDNVTLKKGMDFAAQLYAAHRQLSPIDLRDIAHHGEKPVRSYP